MRELVTEVNRLPAYTASSLRCIYLLLVWFKLRSLGAVVVRAQIRSCSWLCCHKLLLSNGYKNSACSRHKCRGHSAYFMVFIIIIATFMIASIIDRISNIHLIAKYIWTMWLYCIRKPPYLGGLKSYNYESIKFSDCHINWFNAFFFTITAYLSIIVMNIISWNIWCKTACFFGCLI